MPNRPSRQLTSVVTAAVSGIGLAIDSPISEELIVVATLIDDVDAKVHREVAVVAVCVCLCAYVCWGERGILDLLTPLRFRGRAAQIREASCCASEVRVQPDAPSAAPAAAVPPPAVPQGFGQPSSALAPVHINTLTVKRKPKAAAEAAPQKTESAEGPTTAEEPPAKKSCV